MKGKLTDVRLHGYRGQRCCRRRGGLFGWFYRDSQAVILVSLLDFKSLNCLIAGSRFIGGF